MKIIFVGGLFPENRKAEFIEASRGVIQFAADTFQWALVKGLDYYFNDVTVFTAPLLGNFPKTYKKIKISSSKFSHNANSTDYCVGSIRIPFGGLISKYIHLKKELLKNHISEPTCLVIYSMHTPFLLAAYRFKKMFPETKVCLIVPDLPQYMSSSKNRIYLLFKKIDSHILNKMLPYVDSFVFVTDPMGDKLPIGDRPWTRIEGIYDSGFVKAVEKASSPNEKIVFYAGNLDIRYGIKTLIDAFRSINDMNYSLWICGNGNMKDKIISASLEDQRIRYLGQISHEKVLEIMQEVTVIVNPRPSKDEYTKYSFPYKTMEYLASGKPCIMNRLPGIPEEYLKYIIVPEDESAECLKSKIIEICNMDNSILKGKGEDAKKFIHEKKNYKAQVLKIYNLLK